jgi:hypothetical protein
MRQMILVAALILPAATAHAQAAQKLKLAPAAIVLQPGQTARDKIPITIVATLSEDELKMIAAGTQPDLVDRTPRTSTTSVISAFEPAGSRLTGTTQIWNFSLKIENFPEYDSETRVFLATYGPIAQTLDYTIANTFSKTFSWSVKMPQEWNLRHQSAHGISISVGDVAATDIALHQVELTSQDARKLTIGRDRFELCAEGAPDTCLPVAGALGPRTSHAIRLRAKTPFPPGQFHGTIAIRAKEKLEPESLTLKVYSPHPRGEIYGALALAIGVLASLLLQVAGRGLLTWLGEKRTVSQLRARHNDLRREFDSLPVSLREAAAEWERTWNQVAKDIANLRAFMSSPVAVPREDDASRVQEFKNAVESITGVFPHFRLLLNGLMRVNGVQERTKKAVECADAAAEIAQVQLGDDAAKEVERIVGALRTATGDERATLASAEVPGEPATELRRVKVLLGTVSVTMWLLWAGISVLTGLAILVFQNPAFGTPFDLVTCALWGLGISVIGQQASQLTPSGIASTVGITIPGGGK